MVSGENVLCITKYIYTDPVRVRSRTDHRDVSLLAANTKIVQLISGEPCGNKCIHTWRTGCRTLVMAIQVDLSLQM